MIPRIRRVVSTAFVVAFVTSCGFFPEATFELSPQSRIPRWFQLDPTTNRADVQVKLSYYISSAGRTAKITLKRKGAWFSNSVACTQRGLEPIYLGSPSTKLDQQYPSFEVITCKGVTEVIEHRAMEPTFFVTDDPSVLRKLGLAGNPKANN
jgi:hypothetical protein